MSLLSRYDPVDYLVIGHITQDLTPSGPVLGGTASYSALMAHALGLRVGIVTACPRSLRLPPLELDGISVVTVDSEFATTFENVYTPDGRVQYLHHQATLLNMSHVPEAWRFSPIVHLGPVAQEVDPNLVRNFPRSMITLTPQGWLREWNASGKVHFSDWPEASYVLSRASAAVLSIEDVQGNESQIEDMVSSIRILAVTEGAAGARLFWNGDLRRFNAPKLMEVDATGAGDIFATAFFIRLYHTHNPWEAARFANQMAAYSVTRSGLAGIPTRDEIDEALVEIIQ